MAGYEQHKAELANLGVSVFAASVDTGENAQKVANDVSFPIGEGVDRALADTLGAWWEDRRGIVQPTQFVVRGDGSIVQATYSDGPLGRIDAQDVVKLVGFLKK